MSKKDPAQLKKVSLSLPFGIGKAEWESDPSERRAAWDLYVELVTRVAVDQTPTPAGGEAEAIGSLYSLFSATRDILKSAGPDIARSRESVGAIALAVLNLGVRPFLSKWHSRFEDWKASGQHDHGAWPNAEEFRKEMRTLQSSLAEYAAALAVIAGISLSE
jgi:hypothetical protein